MNWQFTPYTPFLLITAAACLTLTAIVFRRHRKTSTLATTLLPGVSGDEVARLAKLEQSLTLVLMTGWSLAPTDPRLASFDLALQKLFDAREAEAMILRAIEMEAQTGKPETPDSIMSDS